MNDLNANLENVNARMAAACNQANRDPGEICIVAVSKGQAAGKIRLLRTASQLAFGENYVQEALEKQENLIDLNIEWHFIGPVQSNKTREIARHFHWVQSVDREKILSRLSRQRPEGLPDLNICLQVNIDQEAQKSGARPEDIPQLAQLASSLPRLKLRGLMAIPRLGSDGRGSARSFQGMYGLYRNLSETGLALDTLSMGMSADLELAIQAGSTMVRIGTGLFGSRN